MWTGRFLQRHPEYRIRKQKTLDVRRKQAHDVDELRRWFEQYKRIRDERGILPQDTYNFDETGFRIGIRRDQWVVTRDSKKPCPLLALQARNWLQLLKQSVEMEQFSHR